MMLLKILLVLLQFFKGISSLVFSVSAAVDHSAILPCDVSNCMGFHWIKNHPIRTPVAKCIEERCAIEEGFQGRFKLAENINNGKYSLLINSVKFNDRGIYQCKCNGITNDVTLQVDVYINVTAEESANITLPCYADTQTDVNDVTWIHNDQQKVLHYLKDGHTNLGKGYEGRVSLTNDGFKYGDLSLTLTEVQKTDAGLYRCFVHDVTTKGDPHSYMLHVNGKIGKPQKSELIFLLIVAIIIIIFMFAIIVIVLVLLYKRRTTKSPTDFNHPLTSVRSSQPRKKKEIFLRSSL